MIQDENIRKLVIFDLAGTLIDEGNKAPMSAFKSAFNKHNYEISEEEINQFMGLNKKDHISLLLQESVGLTFDDTPQGNQLHNELVDDVYSAFQESLNEYIVSTSKPIPGVPEVIENIKKLNVSVAITTGYNRETVNLIEDNLKDWELPGVVITSDDVSDGRPFPYMCFRAMEFHTIFSVEDCVKIGDTISDIYAASNAGIRSYGVLSGATTQEDFEFLNIQYMDSVADWFQFLPKFESERCFDCLYNY